MRTRCKGSRKHSIDMVDVANAYRRARAGRSREYAQAQELGKAATQHARATGSHAFGGSARDVALALQRAKRHCLAKTIADSDDDASSRAFALAARLSTSQAGIADALVIARLVKRAESARRVAIAKEDEATLDEFHGTTGKDLCRGLQNSIPALRSCPLQACPSPFGLHVDVQPPDSADLAGALSWACDHSHFSGMSSLLQRQWGTTHETIMDAECPDVTDAPEESACYKYGLCLCSEEGVEVKRRANKFLNTMKAVCPKGSINRNLLRGGKLVFHLQGRPRTAEEFFESEDPLKDIWLHAGLMLFNPYEPTLMEVAPTADVGETDPDPRRIYVASQGRYMNIFKAMEPFAKCGIITVRWYEVECTERRIATFLPRTIPILDMFRGEARRWWPRALPVRRVKGGDAGAGGSDDGDDDDTGDAPLVPIEDVEAESEHDPVAEYEELLAPLLDAYEEYIPVPTGEDGSGGGGDLPGPPTPTGLPPADSVPPPLPPPLEPPPAAMDSRFRGKQRKQDALTVCCPSGTISWFQSNGKFQVTCFAHIGERCTMTRVSRESGAAGSTDVRRPLGLLALWLEECHTNGDDKATHKEKKFEDTLKSAECRDARYQARLRFCALPGAEALLEKEDCAGDKVGIELEPSIIK